MLREARSGRSVVLVRLRGRGKRRMSLMTHEIEYRRLRAPQEDGGTLVDPPRAAVGDLIQRNEAVLDRFGAQAVETRRALIAAAVNYTRQYRDCDAIAAESPIFIAGHQP